MNEERAFKSPYCDGDSLRTQNDFQNWARGKANSILTLLQEKGGQYTGLGNSAFANFEMSAAQWDTDPLFQIMQAAQKHWTFLVKSAKQNPDERSSHRMQITGEDMIVYMLLLIYWEEEYGVTNLPGRGN